ALADHDRQLAFVVEMRRSFGTNDRLSGGDEGIGPAWEERGIRRRAVAAFLGVLQIVQADTDELGRTRDGQSRLERGEWRLRGRRCIGGDRAQFLDGPVARLDE